MRCQGRPSSVPVRPPVRFKGVENRPFLSRAKYETEPRLSFRTFVAEMGGKMTQFSLISLGLELRIPPHFSAKWVKVFIFRYAHLLTSNKIRCILDIFALNNCKMFFACAFCAREIGLFPKGAAPKNDCP